MHETYWHFKIIRISDNYITQLKIYIGALSETRLVNEEKVTEDMEGYTLCWKGVAMSKKTWKGCRNCCQCEDNCVLA